jgi:hydroxymethylglutaryl-CoA lyase
MVQRLNLPRKVRVGDVTARDGFQNLEQLIPTEAKLYLIEGLIDAGFREFEVGAFAPPRYQAQFRDVEEVIKGLPRRDDVVYSCVTTGRRATERAFKAREAGLRVDRIVLGMITSSERDNKTIVGMGYAETWKWIEESLEKAHALGMKVNVFLTGIWDPPELDASSSPMERALECTDKLLDMGVDDIEHPDHTGNATPDKVYDYFVRILEKHPDADRHNCHIHDQRGMGMACYLSAMMAGIHWFETSLGGLGGYPAPIVDRVPQVGLFGLVEHGHRTGLVSTEDFVVMLESMGIETGLDTDKVLRLGRVVEKMVGRQLWAFSLSSGPVWKTPPPPKYWLH